MRTNEHLSVTELEASCLLAAPFLLSFSLTAGGWETTKSKPPFPVCAYMLQIEVPGGRRVPGYLHTECACITAPNKTYKCYYFENPTNRR